MNFYHNLITEKSWRVLQELRKKYDFILIGGWAVFLYTQALKSKDVDLVMEYGELERLREDFEVSKNARLKKYEARLKEAEIDIYVPFYSNPGLLAEELKKFTTNVAGFKTVKKEILAILKQKALVERVNTVKGRKDLIDLISLFLLKDFDWSKYRQTVTKYKLEEYCQLINEIIKKTREIKELDLNVHRIAKFKKKVLPLVGK